ncbi:helix-turn-helix domain-containing protein [Hominifimenecus sp. rT4P-3]|uniref:helix-turn-helix domain-containing protein n=1 Tax=Hominifimenecus sp. rT4P-3 TaxID=3242979 RepID=UPI003DA420A7
MQLGKVIKTYRKSKNMTQEEMARRLGVTAPAVNKWESGNSFPDIMLLAPIARLLDISLDTLLAFHEEPTAEEVEKLVYEADRKLKEGPYEEAFLWAKKILEQYPNCELLIWQIAVILDAKRDTQEVSNAEQYDEYLHSLYVRVLESKDEALRGYAAGSLFAFYMKKERYDKAEQCLEYFSKQDPERKRRQAEIYGETNRIQEAYKACEELLFSSYQTVSETLQGMYWLAVKKKDWERARRFVAKQGEMARCFEMGRYYEVSNQLDLATLEKDAETVIETMKEMLFHVDSIGDFCKSPLYEHMKFKPVREEFKTELKRNLLRCFRDEESYGFLKNDKRWQEFIKQE